MYIFIISRSVLIRMRIVTDKIYRGNQNTHIMSNNGFFFENRIVYEKIWRTRIALWITKAINTHS